MMRRFVLVLLMVLLPILPARAAGRFDGVPRTAVISAFGPELAELQRQTTNKRRYVDGGVIFTTGMLEGRPVVLLLSGVSMVNAAMTTQLALDRFNVRRIVFSGVGGGVDPSLRVGDVVVPERWAEYLEMSFARQAADGFGRPPDAVPDVASYGMMFPSPVTVQRRPGAAERRTWFPVDPAMLAAARAAAGQAPLRRCDGARCLDQAPKMVVGGNGVSGSAFVDNAAFRQYVFTAFHAEVLDMETAAVAHVAYADGAPFIAFRSLSDLAGGDPGPNPFRLFVPLAADNSAAAVRHFLKSLP